MKNYTDILMVQTSRCPIALNKPVPFARSHRDLLIDTGLTENGRLVGKIYGHKVIDISLLEFQNGENFHHFCSKFSIEWGN